MNYYFISYTARNNKSKVGGGAPIVVCSCSIRMLHKYLLDYYNECAVHKANNIIINSLTVLDKQTAAQLSNNFTDCALIIDDQNSKM